MIIKFDDGTKILDYTIEEHNDWEDSYSIAEVINYILKSIQMDIEDGKRQFQYDENGVVDLVKTVGVSSVQWETKPRYSEVKYNDDVKMFIEEFHHFQHDVAATFTMRCCYWFAVIMHERFPDSVIKIAETVITPREEIEKLKAAGLSGRWIKEERSCLHFITEIDGRDYDITGDVTGMYKSIPWSEYPDGARKEYIISESIKMTV